MRKPLPHCLKRMSQPIAMPGRAILGDATGRTLEEHYEMFEVLGRGSFSVVHRARHRQTGEEFACKVIDKWSIHNRQRLANEVGRARGRARRRAVGPPPLDDISRPPEPGRARRSRANADRRACAADTFATCTPCSALHPRASCEPDRGASARDAPVGDSAARHL